MSGAEGIALLGLPGPFLVLRAWYTVLTDSISTWKKYYSMIHFYKNIVNKTSNINAKNIVNKIL